MLDLLFVICYLNFALAAPAVAATKLIVSPPRTEVTLNPGESAQKTVKVTNDSDSPLTLRALVIDYIVDNDNGTPIKVSLAEAGRFAASPWFTTNAPTFTLAPRESMILDYVITAPGGALPGGHYAGIFFEPIADLDQKGTASFTLPQVGSIFAITIPGDIKESAYVKTFTAAKNLYEFGPVDFAASLTNDGDIHISPKATIKIKDMLGREVAAIPLKDVNIFPFTSRSWDARWDKVWGLGRYSATLEAAYGSGLVASATILFWILPYRILAAIGVLILVLIALFILIRRHLRHRADTSAAEIEALKRRIVELENSHS